MNLIERFENGQVGKFGVPQQIRETAISRLFFFGDRVVKIYKRENYFFADLSDEDARRTFFQDDFFWNHACAPEIYLKLGEFDDDFYIEMKRIDDSRMLTKLFERGDITSQDVESMTRALIERLHLITLEHPEKLDPHIKRTLRSLMRENIEDLRHWMDMGLPLPEKGTGAALLAMLQKAVDTDDYFESAPLGAAIDNNSDNLLFIEGKPSFIDIMGPKTNWRVLDEHGTVARTAVDAFVLSGNGKLRDAVYRTHRDYTGSAPPVASLTHELRAACIQWPYRHMLNQPELAEKFKAFALAKTKELETFIGQATASS